MSKSYSTKHVTIQAAQALTANWVTQGDSSIEKLTVDTAQKHSGHGKDQLVFELAYSKGDETSVEFRVQWSDTPEFTIVYTDVVLETSSGVSTIYPRTYTRTNSDTNWLLPVACLGYYFRVQAKGTGSPTGTLATKVRLYGAGGL